MCRFAAYLGPPAPLSTLLYDPPRSLHEQAYAPWHQHDGNVNVDGTGVAWWDGDDPEPLRYATDRPPWSDPNLWSLAPRLRAPVQLAAVRSTTPGMPHGPGAVAPFTDTTVAGVHNGQIERFAETVARPLTQDLPPSLFARLDPVSDSHVLFLTVLAAALEDPGSGLAGSVGTALRRVLAACRSHDVTASLTLALSDGERVVAVTTALGRPANTLFTLNGGRRWPEATLVASEPLDDDPAWRAVEPDRLIEATADGVQEHPPGDWRGDWLSDWPQEDREGRA